ncbi:NADH-ubiquinone oxidoreductase [Podospora australis]|uniref:NADH dehydrogenase [ubiquinone] iron-sulfur protein 4, mitochondrial n=1 Tax=Podospora australis TaxID=1536484 RepID=A0AAN6WR64_9PEZI|nr:NADH-ubiquinone oxidoreductase [Podospora australis]
MASLRPTPASAARLVRATTATTPATVLPAARRFKGALSVKDINATESSNVPSTSSTALKKALDKDKNPMATLPRNSPDYNVPIDKATSMFTPVPKSIQDGSEPDIPLPAGLISGAPLDLQARTVRIFKQSKPATQSGTAKSNIWRMDWDILGKGHRWENPLMGWQSSADHMQAIAINFKSKEDAIAFAEKQGYEYFVQEPNQRHFAPKAYANNFMYSPGKLKHIRTK